jgi:DNA polymerase
MLNLTSLNEQISRCTACELSESRTKAVPGEGPNEPDVMFIGEAPGFYEDREGTPFVGQSGKFLNQLIKEAGLTREEVFISNIVKCRPPNNRDPLPNEIDTCDQLWLSQQIQALKPKVIVTLGRHSLSRFLPNETISHVHGQPRRKGEMLIFPMYHPAAALHQPKLRETLINDMQKLPAVIEKETKMKNQDDLARVETDEPNTEQLRML